MENHLGDNSQTSGRHVGDVCETTFGRQLGVVNCGRQVENHWKKIGRPGDHIPAGRQNTVGDKVEHTVGDQVRDTVGDTVGDKVRDKVGDQVGDKLGDKVGDTWKTRPETK